MLAAELFAQRIVPAKAQFKYADKQGFMFVATVGESELDSGSYALKRMRDGHAETISRDNFAASLPPPSTASLPSQNSNTVRV